MKRKRRRCPRREKFLRVQQPLQGTGKLERCPIALERRRAEMTNP